MLFAMNEKGEIKPQMVDSFQARGQAHLELHAEGRAEVARRQPVTAEDCVASLNRWAVRDPLGRMLMAATDSSRRRASRPSSSC